MRVSYAQNLLIELPRFQGIGHTFERQADQGGVWDKIRSIFNRVFHPAAGEEPYIFEAEIDFDTPGYWKGNSTKFDKIRDPNGERPCIHTDAFAVKLNVIRQIEMPANSLPLRVLEQFFRMIKVLISGQRAVVPTAVLIPGPGLSLPSTMLQYVEADQKVSYTITHEGRTIPVTLIIKANAEVDPSLVLLGIHERLHKAFNQGMEQQDWSPKYVENEITEGSPNPHLTREQLENLSIFEMRKVQELALEEQRLMQEREQQNRAGEAELLREQERLLREQARLGIEILREEVERFQEVWLKEQEEAERKRDLAKPCKRVKVKNFDTDELHINVPIPKDQVQIAFDEGRKVVQVMGHDSSILARFELEDMGGEICTFDATTVAWVEEKKRWVVKINTQLPPPAAPVEEPVTPPVQQKPSYQRITSGYSNQVVVTFNNIDTNAVTVHFLNEKKLLQVTNAGAVLAEYLLEEGVVYTEQTRWTAKGGQMFLTAVVKAA